MNIAWVYIDLNYIIHPSNYGLMLLLKKTITDDWTLDYSITENSLILYNLYHKWEIFDSFTGKPKSLLSFDSFYSTRGVHPIMIFTIKNSDYIYYYTDKALYNIYKVKSRKV